MIRVHFIFALLVFCTASILAASSATSKKLVIKISHSIDLSENGNLSSHYNCNNDPTSQISFKSKYGQASLYIQNDGKVGVQHFGKGFVILLSNSKTTEYASYAYPHGTTLDQYGPFSVPENAGSFVSVQPSDHILLGIPLRDNPPFKRNLPSSSSLLASYFNTRSSGENENYIEVLDDTFKEIIRDGLFGTSYLLIKGQFAMMENTSQYSLTNITPKFQGHSYLAALMAKMTVIRTIKMTAHLNLDRLVGSEIDQKYNMRTYLSENFVNGASFQLLFEEGKYRLVYEQFGRANVLLIRPGKGLVFPKNLEFLGKASHYGAIENRTPTLIDQSPVPEDLIIVLFPLKEETKADLKDIINWFKGMITVQSMDDLVYCFKIYFKDIFEDLFISISKVAAVAFQ